MSVIGPRPTLRYQVEQYDEHQRHRLDIRPGLTGWAQVHGRAELPVGRAHRARRLVRREPLAARRPRDPPADAARALPRDYRGATGGWRRGRDGVCTIALRGEQRSVQPVDVVDEALDRVALAHVRAPRLAEPRAELRVARELGEPLRRGLGVARLDEEAVDAVASRRRARRRRASRRPASRTRAPRSRSRAFPRSRTGGGTRRRAGSSRRRPPGSRRSSVERAMPRSCASCSSRSRSGPSPTMQSTASTPRSRVARTISRTAPVSFTPVMRPTQPTTNASSRDPVQVAVVEVGGLVAEPLVERDAEPDHGELVGAARPRARRARRAPRGSRRRGRRSYARGCARPGGRTRCGPGRSSPSARGRGTCGRRSAGARRRRRAPRLARALPPSPCACGGCAAAPRA